MFLVMARSTKLGSEHEVTLRTATIRYRETGDGPPVVFVHGLLVNGDLWNEVVPPVAGAGFRCITPDWPLGSHEVPVPDADLTPPGFADLIAEFLGALDLQNVTLVANDTGGAITQILLTRHPERIGRVVLTPCDAFERFFPPVFAFLPHLARVPLLVWLLTQTLRVRALHRLPFTFGWLSKRPLPRELVDSFLEPSRRDPAIRRDLRRFTKSVHRRHTLAAAAELHRFDRPVLLAWAPEDRLFPLALARRIADALPDARIETIEDALTFVPQDQPRVLADLVVNFLRAQPAPNPS